MQTIRWGIIGCGKVTEVKSGPGFQNADGSELVAVMRRDAALAADYARRHDVPRSHGSADDLIADPEVDAVYVATPPSSHCELSLKVAEAGKPCFVEKPMAMNDAEGQWMVEGFKKRGVPLYVAYYRRAFPMFLKVRELLREGAIGTLSSVHIVQYGRLDTGEKALGWRYDPAVGGGGLFMDVGSHGLDILDFLISPIRAVGGFSLNTGGAYAVEDVTAAAFEFETGSVGTGVWNFNADHSEDLITLTGSEGEIRCPVFSDGGILIKKGTEEESIEIQKPEHVHQPMIQTIVDELLGRGLCESTGESGARTGWVMEECLKAYYRRG